MALLDNTYGACLVGVLISNFLMGVQTVQSYIYSHNYPNDGWDIKALVYTLLVIGVAHTFFLGIMMYHYLIVNFGNFAALVYNTWSFNIEVVLTPVLAFLVQMFFARRAWLLNRKNYLLSTAIATLAFIQLTFGLTCGALVFHLPMFTDFVKYRWAVGMWLGGAAACDIVLTTSLCYTLYRSKTGFKKTDTLVTKLIICLFAIIDLICFCIFNNDLHLTFNFCLGKLYPIMMLATLNQRRGCDELTEHDMNSMISSVRNTKKTGNVTSQMKEGIRITTHTSTAGDYPVFTEDESKSRLDSAGYYTGSPSIEGDNVTHDLEGKRVRLE
ncbi:hypothetical protein BOTBODRAFT_178647 [Botryobasidium botryosum FD-172 SS1]|uniref:DUF6534 domain-containing protein n=1 Tax=Botryobasidium botryosum (strain FD-172 SS1) TaxID=930990 RepID=A0A067MDH9_BOTB1|nr:hypothetical protein BOTBODRAFT_178647 [Botryobasidium botryosum FD-172 SS1]